MCKSGLNPCDSITFALSVLPVENFSTYVENAWKECDHSENTEPERSHVYCLPDGAGCNKALFPGNAADAGPGRENEPLYARIAAMLDEEQSHLDQFCSYTDCSQISQDRQTLLTALMQDWLFKGGLMGAARQGMMEDIPSMIQYAQDSEALSAKKYREFAEMTSDEVTRQTLLSIAAEEDKHFLELNGQENV